MVELGAPSLDAEVQYRIAINELKDKYPMTWMTEAAKPSALKPCCENEEALLAVCIDAMILTGLCFWWF